MGNITENKYKRIERYIENIRNKWIWKEIGNNKWVINKQGEKWR
jgi:hypothetical protein